MFTSRLSKYEARFSNQPIRQTGWQFYLSRTNLIIQMQPIVIQFPVANPIHLLAISP
jgi:hypothetical protein